MSLRWAYSGFHEARPVLFIDGTHLNESTGGVALIASYLDANNEIVILSVAIVSIENIINWTWFVDLLRRDCQLDHIQGLVIVSDRQKGLLNAVSKVPSAQHLFCLHHLECNVRARYKSAKIVQLYWQAAQAKTIAEHEEAMHEIRAQEKNAFLYLSALPQTSWATAFTGRTFGARTSSVAESVNSLLRDSRRKSCLSFLQDVVVLQMRQIETRRMAIEKWNSPVSPWAKAKIDDAIKKARRISVTVCGPIGYTVCDNVVNLVDETCSCGEFFERGLPCEHACALSLHKGQDPSIYASCAFSSEVLKRLYNIPIVPVSLNLLSSDNLQPPITVNKIGRPKKRIASLGELASSKKRRT